MSVCRRFPVNAVKQAAQLLVDICDFAIVRATFILLTERRWRPVWHVRIVQVDPEKEGLAGLPVEPAQRTVDGLACIALGILQEFLPVSWQRHLIVVNSEPLVESKKFFQDIGAYESCSIPALLLKYGGQRL